MRPDEEFVARALVEFFGGPASASVTNGEDPPDFYITVGASRIGVEVTRLSQFTFEPNGILGNRATQDFFGTRLLDELDGRIGPSLPDHLSLLVGLWVPVSNAARFRKGLTSWVSEVAASAREGLKEEREIEGSNTTISVRSKRPSGKRIVGFVANKNSSADIGLNARLILEDRIRTKSEICTRLPKPIWLAVFNDYWLADADTYAVACRQLKLAHCFQRLFLVSDEGAVDEITIGA